MVEYVCECGVSLPHQATPTAPPLQDMFETVNKAYEFLCSKVSRTTEGPDPDNIILILKTQTILYTRHNEGVRGRGGEGREV